MARTSCGTSTTLKMPPATRMYNAFGMVLALLKRSASSAVPMVKAISSSRTNPVTRDTTVPSAIQALLRARSADSAGSVIDIPVERLRWRGLARLRLTAEPPGQGDDDEGGRQADRHPQRGTHAAGPHVEDRRRTERLSIGGDQAGGERRRALAAHVDGDGEG